MLAFRDVQCPYCGESIEIALDASVEHQQYIEDCQVCCRPIVLTVTFDEDAEPHINARAENEG